MAFDWKEFVVRIPDIYKVGEVLGMTGAAVGIALSGSVAGEPNLADHHFADEFLTQFSEVFDQNEADPIEDQTKALAHLQELEDEKRKNEAEALSEDKNQSAEIAPPLDNSDSPFEVTEDGVVNLNPDDAGKEEATSVEIMGDVDKAVENDEIVDNDVDIVSNDATTEVESNQEEADKQVESINEEQPYSEEVADEDKSLQELYEEALNEAEEKQSEAETEAVENGQTEWANGDKIGGEEVDDNEEDDKDVVDIYKQDNESDDAVEVADKGEHIEPPEPPPEPPPSAERVT